MTSKYEELRRDVAVGIIESLAVMIVAWRNRHGH